MSGGHLSASVVDAYRRGAVAGAAGAAVEIHLQSCAACRGQLQAATTSVEPSRFDRNWFAITAELDAPKRGVIERVLVSVGLPADTVRVMAATPALRRAWFIAVGIALLFGLAASNPDRPDGTILWFLALAPLIPVVGVALAYGPGIDPSYEISLAAPMSGLRLVLVRACAVVGTSIVLGGLVSLLMVRRHEAMVIAWLLPALALSVVCLAVMTVLSSRMAAAVVTFAWLAVVIGFNTRAADQLVLFRPPMQAVYLLVAVSGAVVVLVRRRSFDVAEGAVS